MSCGEGEKDFTCQDASEDSRAAVNQRSCGTAATPMDLGFE